MVPIPYKIVERRAGDVVTCFANEDQALVELDWKTTKSIDDMCRDRWNWQSNNPGGYKEEESLLNDGF